MGTLHPVAHMRIDRSRGLWCGSGGHPPRPRGGEHRGASGLETDALAAGVRALRSLWRSGGGGSFRSRVMPPVGIESGPGRPRPGRGRRTSGGGAGPMLKRVFDVATVIVFAPVWVPLLAIVAVIVRARLGTPVLFRQQRPGYRARIFE